MSYSSGEFDKLSGIRKIQYFNMPKHFSWNGAFLVKEFPFRFYMFTRLTYPSYSFTSFFLLFFIIKTIFNSCQPTSDEYELALVCLAAGRIQLSWLWNRTLWKTKHLTSMYLQSSNFQTSAALQLCRNSCCIVCGSAYC